MLCGSKELTQVQDTLLLLQKSEVTPESRHSGMNAESSTAPGKCPSKVKPRQKGQMFFPLLMCCGMPW